MPAPTTSTDTDPRKTKLELRKLEAEARKLEVEARAAELAAVIPDLSKVVVPELGKVEGQATGGTRVTFGALEDAADKVAAAVKEHGPSRILVTSDPDLAAGDAVYQDAKSAIETLEDAAKALLPSGREGRAFLDPVSLAAIATGVVPQAISLLLPKRGFATSSVTVDDLAASAEVAGALLTLGLPVVPDAFRTLPAEGIYKRLADLSDVRRRLVEHKLELARKAERAEGALDDEAGNAKTAANRQRGDCNRHASGRRTK